MRPTAMRLRLLALGAAAALLLPPATHAQGLIACQGGTAGGFACNGVGLFAHIPVGVDGPLHSGGMNDIWGWTDPDTGHEYALAGTRSGTVFVDVTDPAAPAVLGKMITQSDNSTWRDIKVYADYAFVVSEAYDHGIQVFDLTRLRGLTPDDTREFTPDAVYTGIGKAHNIAIDEATGFAYALGANQSGYDCNAGGLHMVNIQDPTNPTFAGCFDDDGYTHDVQCVVYAGPDADYTGREICMASNEDTVTIVDVTDKANPVLISRLGYVNSGYTHQGWFTEDQRYFLVDDELDELYGLVSNTRTIVYDMTDLDTPEVAFFYNGPLTSSDHNLYIRGQYAFQSNYKSGLRILDLSGIDSGTLTEVAFFDTYSGDNSDGTEGQWSNYPFFESGTVVASDIENGLFILRPDILVTTAAEPAAPEVPGEAGYVLSGPTPNPFQSGTTLELAVARTQAVRAEVLDVAGRRVAVLYDGPVAAGAVQPLRLAAGDLPNGLYLVRITGEDFTATQRVSLVR